MQEATSGERYVVTGGNRGIGFDICRKLIDTGHDVVLCSRRLSAGKEACAKIMASKKSPSGSCQAVELDVADSSAVQQFVQGMADTYSKRIYGLINNAAVYKNGWTKGLFDEALATNFNGPLELALGLAPHMKEGGRIVNVGSMFSQLSCLSGPYQSLVRDAANLDDLRRITFTPDSTPAPLNPTYCLTKAMLNRATQILAKTAALGHLSINAADPGWVRSDAGGPYAPRSIEKGSASILAILKLPSHITGGFFLDGKPQKF